MNQYMPMAPGPADITTLPIFDLPPDPAAQPHQQRLDPAAGSAHLFAAIGVPPTDSGHVAAPTAPHDGDVDWGLVAVFRKQVSDLMAGEVSVSASRAETEAAGRRLIIGAVRDHTNSLLREGQQGWSNEYVQKMHMATFSAIFGLGRIQPLIEAEGVENIMIFGADQVYLDYGNRDIRKVGPVADSDAELIEQIQFIAGREGERGRPWSSVAWQLRMTLPGGERLQATHPPITPRPHIVIRRHPLISTTLQDLIAHGSLTASTVAFLAAAVKARKSIVVAGQPGTGKTTLVRALAHEMDPLEHIVTIESERELHLDKSGHHQLVTAFESRPGQGEIVNGQRTGEVNLDELIAASLRHNSQRLIVGEVLGPEVGTMIQAMQAGAGAMCTIHANSPTETIERIALLVAMSGVNASINSAYRLIEQHVDFIVQLSNYTGGEHAGVRYVSEVSEVVAGEGERPLCQAIFKARPSSTVAELVERPQDHTLADLAAAGFNAEHFFPGWVG